MKDMRLPTQLIYMGGVGIILACGVVHFCVMAGVSIVKEITK